MGHHPSELAAGTDTALRKKYSTARKKLENLRLSELTVGELVDVLEMLAAKRTPIDFYGPHAETHVGDRVTEINRLLAKLAR